MLNPLEFYFDSSIEFPSISLDNFLRGILSGDTDPMSLRLDLYIACRQAQYHPITMNGLIAVMNDQSQDPSFMALYQAMINFAQSDGMPAVKRINKENILTRHLYIGHALQQLTNLCRQNMSEEEMARLTQNKPEALQKKLMDHIRRKLKY